MDIPSYNTFFFPRFALDFVIECVCVDFIMPFTSFQRFFLSSLCYFCYDKRSRKPKQKYDKKNEWERREEKYMKYVFLIFALISFIVNGILYTHYVALKFLVLVTLALILQSLYTDPIKSQLFIVLNAYRSQNRFN